MTDRVLHHIAFYPSDWLAGTRGLTAAETGVYITLVAMMYEREGPLDMDDARLARLCGMPKPAFLKAMATLESEGKIVRGDSGIWNARVAHEIAQARNRIEKRTTMARQAANARWEKAQQNQSGHDAGAMPEQCQPEPEPDIRDDAEESRAPSAPSPSADPTLREQILKLCGADPVSGFTGFGAQQIGTRNDTIEMDRWKRDLGLTDTEITAVVSDVMRKRRDPKPIGSFTYFTGPMQDEAGRKSREPLKPSQQASPPLRVVGEAPTPSRRRRAVADPARALRQDKP